MQAKALIILDRCCFANLFALLFIVQATTFQCTTDLLYYLANLEYLSTSRYTTLEVAKGTTVTFGRALQSMMNAKLKSAKLLNLPWTWHF